MRALFYHCSMKNEPEKLLNNKKNNLSEIFVFTDEEGKVKNLDLVYALLLGLTILFVYYGIQNFLTLRFETWFSGLSRTALNVLDIGVSSIISTGVFCGIMALLKNKKPIVMGYFTALLFTLVVALIMLIKYKKDTLAIALPVVIYMFFIPILFGTVCVYLLYKKSESK